MRDECVSLFSRILHLACAVVLGASATATLSAAEPVRIIFDADMDSDCDDVGALAVLHALADLGECEILATVASSQNEWTPACMDAINTFYGRGNLPIGAPKRAGTQKKSKYARPIAERFPQDLGTTGIPDAMDVYRRVLAAQPDESVVIVTVGYLTNVADLLRLPAGDDQPSGRELVERKVVRWVCMGGNFIGRPAYDDVKLSNNNFTFDKANSLYAVSHWPKPLQFVGREIGSVPSGLKVGANLKRLPEANPIRFGYAVWFDGEPQDRHVADQTTVLCAVRGLRDYWNEESHGYMDLQPDMTFTWRNDRDSQQSYLLKRSIDGKSNDRTIERIIDELMLQSPRNQ